MEQKCKMVGKKKKGKEKPTERPMDHLQELANVKSKITGIASNLRNLTRVLSIPKGEKNIAASTSELNC